LFAIGRGLDERPVAARRSRAPTGCRGPRDVPAPALMIFDRPALKPGGQPRRGPPHGRSDITCTSTQRVARRHHHPQRRAHHNHKPARVPQRRVGSSGDKRQPPPAPWPDPRPRNTREPARQARS
jgi:hypothetical protein